MNNYRCRNYRNSNTENDIDVIEQTNINQESTEIRQSCNMTCNQNNTEDNCMCGFDMNDTSAFPSNPMYGQSYVPIQQMNKVFNPETGLKMGTIYPELVSPYSPCQSIRTIEFLKNSNEIGEGCNG